MNLASLFQGIATLAWLAFVGFLALAIIRAGQNRPIKNATATVIIVAAFAIIATLVAGGMVFIEPQERGVVISAISPQGYRDKPLDPGLRWIIPFAERVELYPISRQTYTMSIAPSEGQIANDDSITARTADGQEIYIDASIIFQINPDEVVNVHIRWQDRYTDELVRAQARGIIRDAVSQFGVEEVYSTRRLDLTSTITEQLTIKLEENGLTLVDFVLRNITFSPEYAASIEQKQIAEQTAEQAKFVVEQKRQEAEQARQVAQGRADAAVIDAKGIAEARIIEAEAEAEALAVIAGVLEGNPDLLTYEYISKLSPSIQTMLLPSNSPFVFTLPEGGLTTVPEPTPTP